MDRFFTPGKEILLPRSADDVVGYLTGMNDAELREIGRRGQERVMAEHTAQKRAEDSRSTCEGSVFLTAHRAARTRRARCYPCRAEVRHAETVPFLPTAAQDIFFSAISIRMSAALGVPGFGSSPPPARTRWTMRFLLPILLLISASLLGQLSAPMSDSAPAMYEGQKVGSIDIATQPQISTDALRSMLRQKVNEPYSKAQVQQSMDDLKQTQRFSKVQLRVEPAPNGLKLTFVLEPAFYMGLIDFPGGLKLFRYTRLLQVADLPNDQPYQQSQIKKAADSLATFLNHNGFFEATVRPEVEYDEAHQLANVTFHMALNHRAKVGQINFVGPTPETRPNWCAPCTVGAPAFMVTLSNPARNTRWSGSREQKNTCAAT